MASRWGGSSSIDGFLRQVLACRVAGVAGSGKSLGIKVNRHEKCIKSTVDNGNKCGNVRGGRSLLGEADVKLLKMIAIKVGRRVPARCGNSMVEFALVLPLFILLTFGILDFGRLFWTQETLSYALREAGRASWRRRNRASSRVPRAA